MDALDIVLIGLVAILATALAVMLLARLRDLRTVREHREQLDHARAATDELAQERSKRAWVEAELHAARQRIAELELGERQLEPAGRFSRR